MIYAVVNGWYSDWEIKGYFNTKEEAEKYCVSKESGRDCYVIPIKSLALSEQTKNIKVYKYHEVVFDYKKDGTFEMRNEPTRYSISSELDENRIIKCSGEFALTRWLAFLLSDDSREHAEKICQDLMTVIMNEYVQNVDVNGR